MDSSFNDCGRYQNQWRPASAILQIAMPSFCTLLLPMPVSHYVRVAGSAEMNGQKLPRQTNSQKSASSQWKRQAGVVSYALLLAHHSILLLSHYKPQRRIICPPLNMTILITKKNPPHGEKSDAQHNSRSTANRITRTIDKK